LTVHGSSTPHPGNYIGVDPTYTDAFGQPLGMMTFDFPHNDRLMSRHVTQKAAEIARAMGGKQIAVSWLDEHYSIVPYQTTHNTGGAIMGTDPTTSVVNKYLQSWDLHNLWVLGACATRRMPVTTLRARSARSPTGPPMRSSTAICRTRDRWCRREDQRCSAHPARGGPRGPRSFGAGRR
jgi:choline dehydrogenase-like flavoprotein